MNFKQYQDLALKTKVYKESIEVLYPSLGLCGEAGELANKIKKIARDDLEVTDKLKDDLSHELGDCLWYLSALASDLGLSLEDIAAKNLQKLILRKKRGTIHGSGDFR